MQGGRNEEVLSPILRSRCPPEKKGKTRSVSFDLAYDSVEEISITPAGDSILHKLRKWFSVYILATPMIWLYGFFTINAQVNMDNRGIDFGFDFLSQEASFDMQFTLLDYDGQDSYFWAYVVALLNTLLVSFLGIIFCTILGVIIGVARLSQNYLIRNSAGWYVEFFRNIPLLLQIFFWYYAALRALPLPEKAEPWLGVTYMTIKGYYVPSMIWNNLDIFMYSLLAAFISIFVIRNYARKIQEKEGKQIPVLYISFALITVLPLLSFLIGGVTLDFEIPVFAHNVPLAPNRVPPGTFNFI